MSRGRCRLEALSPNAGPRRGGARPDLVVLHHTAMRTADAALARLRDPAAEVSAHYLVAEDGRVWSLVPEELRAWHAGAGRWGEVTDVNSRSIGIELANPGSLAGFPPFPEPQMAALEALLADILARFAIPPARVIAHSDMAPGRKGDPGPKFDWRRLAARSLAVSVDGGAGEAECLASDCLASDCLASDWPAFRRAAGLIGYAAPEGGSWEDVLAAFRLRFRPGAAGPLAPADTGIAEALARAHPCIDPAPLPT